MTDIACECARTARYSDHRRNATGSDLTRLRLSALAGRIENHGIEATKVRRAQWRLEQIAPLGMERFEADGARRGTLECDDCRFVLIECKDARLGGKPQCKRSDAGEQVG